MLAGRFKQVALIYAENGDRILSDTSVTRESVWDYPRPPRLEPTSRRIRVVHAGVIIADTTHALRMLETSHPPVYYIPRSDVRMEFLKAMQGKRTFCVLMHRFTGFSALIGP